MLDKLSYLLYHKYAFVRNASIAQSVRALDC